jgi:adenylosuccinate lyase
MIERYSLPEMAQVWTQEEKFRTWLEVELAVVDVQETMGIIPQGVSQDVAQKANFDIDRIDTIELEVKHDVIAFLTSVAEFVGENSRYVHLGMTSSDLIDTALSLQIQKAGHLILKKLKGLKETIARRAFEHQNTPMVGRSHGIHAEPLTFGLKLLVWVDELSRHETRIASALEENRVGKISGAVGTYSNILPAVEIKTCERLGLKPVLTATQIIQRDIHAQLILALASLASSMEKFAIEIRSLQRTDVLEVEEPFSVGQKGSSAMPHKRNPVSSENITGLARMVRSYAQPCLENIALWHERDISHSSVERIVLPDATILTHYMLNRLTQVMENLVVYPENMKRNMNKYGGIIFSQKVLLELVQKGISREQAYQWVQRNAHRAWNSESGSFQVNLHQDPEVCKTLSPEEIDACFDEGAYLQHVADIFQRFPQAAVSV